MPDFLVPGGNIFGASDDVPVVELPCLNHFEFLAYDEDLPPTAPRMSQLLARLTRAIRVPKLESLAIRLELFDEAALDSNSASEFFLADELHTHLTDVSIKVGFENDLNLICDLEAAVERARKNGELDNFLRALLWRFPTVTNLRLRAPEMSEVINYTSLCPAVVYYCIEGCRTVDSFEYSIALSSMASHATLKMVTLVTVMTLWPGELGEMKYGETVQKDEMKGNVNVAWKDQIQEQLCY